jgi:hypothetical protein
MIPTYFNITLIYIWTPLQAFTLRNAHHHRFLTPLHCRFSPWFVKVGWDSQGYHHRFKNSSDKINHRRLSGWFGSPWKLKFLKSLVLKSIFKTCLKNQTSFELYLNFPWSSYPSQAPPTCLWVPHRCVPHIMPCDNIMRRPLGVDLFHSAHPHPIVSVCPPPQHTTPAIALTQHHPHPPSPHATLARITPSDPSADHNYSDAIMM